MATETIGFIGLGNMGAPMAANVARAGVDMVVYDIAGTAERAPDGVQIGTSVADVARRSTAVLLSLPSIKAGAQVIEEIAGSGAPDGLVVINTSTVGPAAALECSDRLAEKTIAYADAPISGGAFRAQEGTLSVMYSGDAAIFKRLKPVFDAMAANVFFVGDTAGQGQRMKVLNNYLAISAFVTTSEALAYGAAGGLDMKTMLDVVNASSGQNFPSLHMFPKYVLPEDYTSGAAAAIVAKDIGLFVESAGAEGCARHVAQAALDIVQAFADDDPQADQMCIYPFVRDRK